MDGTRNLRLPHNHRGRGRLAIGAAVLGIGLAASAQAAGAVDRPAGDGQPANSPAECAPAEPAEFTPDLLPQVDYFAVPQLGCEPVRGSGCGADDSIGDVVPDGLWRGSIASFDGATIAESTSFEFDLWCAYYGDAAEQQADQWIAENGEDAVPPWTGDDELVINNNPQTRTVPISAEGFVARPAVWTPVSQSADGGTMNRCVSGNGAEPLEVDAVVGSDTWIYIEDGAATQLTRSCPYG